jgi:hypothetical protein
MVLKKVHEVTALVGLALLHYKVTLATGEGMLACPLLLPEAHGCSDKGIGCPPSFVLSHCVRMIGIALLVCIPLPWRLVEVLTA